LLKAGPHASVEDRLRFRVEAESVASLRHPHIIAIHEVGETDGLAFYVMDYAEGGSLAQRLDRGPLPAGEAAHLVEALAGAVEHAHERGIVHRDLKPGNILLTGDGTPKIGDFGLAKRDSGGAGLTQTGAVLGTPTYMAPEQAAGEARAVGPACDIYALGGILYECLTGRPPFQGANPVDVLRQVLADSPVAPTRLQAGLPIDLETICLKCLHKEPVKRYASAGALAEDLGRFRKGVPILARPVGTAEWLLKWAQRRPAVAALLAALILAVTCGTAATTLLWRHAVGERDRADEARAEADTKKLQAQERLVSLHVARGVQRMAEGDLFGSLLWFVKALEEEQGGPEREEMHRIRVAAILRQCPRLRMLLNPDANVSRAQFSPDGRRVVTISAGEGVRVWDAASGRPVSPPFGESGAHMVAFSPDGSRVVTASTDGTARVWDALSGQPVSPPLRHAKFVWKATFSPDGQRLVTASEDQTTQVWDVTTGRADSPRIHHPQAVREARFSPDGHWIVTAGLDAGARVWDAATGQPVSPPLLEGRVITVAFSPDGRWVVAASRGNGSTARVWNAVSGKPVSPPMHHADAVPSAAFSPDGRRVVTASEDQTAQLWDAASGQRLSPALRHAGAVVEAVFSSDGRRIATASLDRTARVWDAVSGQALCPPLRHTAVVLQASLSPDGRNVLVAGGEGAARLWDLAGSQPLLASIKHPRDIRLGAFNADGRTVVTAGFDGRVCVWDAANGQLRFPPILLAGPATDVAFSPDGRRLATGCVDGTARVWDAATAQALSPPLKHERGLGVSTVGLSSDGKRVVTGSEDATARVWDVVAGKAISPPLKHGAAVRHVAFSPDGSCVVTASDDHTARVWDAASGQARGPALEHGGRVRWAAFSPDGQRVVTASEDATARVWDATSGHALGAPLKHPQPVTYASFSPDGARVLTACDDHGARIWEAATGNPLSPPLPHAGPVNYASFSADGRCVVTASEDGTGRVWDASTGQPLSPPLKHSAPLKYAAFSPDSRRVLTASADGTVQIWDLAPDERPLPDLIALAALLSAHRVDDRGNETAVEPALLAHLFEELEAKYPGYFNAGVEEVRAWHREEAKAAEKTANWDVALYHLDRLGQGSTAVHGRRGRAYAALGQWRKALEEFEHDYTDSPKVNEQTFGWHALACAVVGDITREKQICAALLRRFSAPPISANNTAWFCSRFPELVANPDQVVAVAESGLKAHPEDPGFWNTLGVALYRAHRCSEAIRQLERAVDQGHGGTVYDWLFLAMAHEQLADKAEAHAWLAKAKKALDQESIDDKAGSRRLGWDEIAELRLIRKEAEDRLAR
jgi:WD40 repeat protein